MCWGAFIFRRGQVVVSSVYLFSSVCAEYYWPGCFHIARHLAAESGTRCLLPVYMSSLLGVDDLYLGGVLFSGVS